jgi:hypothetical protein
MVSGALSRFASPGVRQTLSPRRPAAAPNRSHDEFSAVVEDATDELRDAPVQAFTSLIAENKARNRLHDLAHDSDHEREEPAEP